MVQYISIPAGLPPIRLPLHLPTEEETQEESRIRTSRISLGDVRPFSRQLGYGGGSLEEVVPTDEEILRWAREVREIFLNKGEYLKTEALQYWVQYTFETTSPENKYVRGRLEELIPDNVLRAVQVQVQPQEETSNEPEESRPVKREAPPPRVEEEKTPLSASGGKRQRQKLSRQHFLPESKERTFCNLPGKGSRTSLAPEKVTCKRCVKLLHEDQKAGSSYLVGVELQDPEALPEGELCPTCEEMVLYTLYCRTCPFPYNRVEE